MERNDWLPVGIVVVLVLTFGTGYWAYARSGHGMNDQESMMENHRHDSRMKNGGNRGMVEMPTMQADMSEEEMGQFCEQMKQRHAAMQSMRQQNTEKLNSLVNSMKQANGSEKIQSMQKVLVELVEQHNKRGRRMMGSMRSMMGSMMGMHRMEPQERQQMMERMRDCPMMKGMMKSGVKFDRENG